MKKLYLALLFLAFGLMAQAQNISVADFYLAENDLTARTHGTSVEDQNGNLCALIKVKTTEKGLWTFDVGMLGVRKRELQNANHSAEIWVYVPFGVTWISIQHDKLGELDHYQLPCSIDKGCTYIMKLTTGKVKTYIEEAVREQYLVFQITPHDALLEVDDQVWPVSEEGISRKLVDFGTFTYRVQAKNYHTEVGKVEVKNPNEAEYVTVTLKPNYGWIEVAGDGNLKGASVFVDNSFIGRAPCKSEILKSGEHTVRIVKEMYATFSKTVTVTDSETTRLSPTLIADFAHVTLQVDADAEIWVNDEKKGIRTWMGDLPSGTYRIECKQSDHEPTSTKIEITKDWDGRVITLNPPQPFIGSLAVESTPDMADLYVDGKLVGKTPKLVSEITAGRHDLRLTKEGYKDYTTTVVIKKNERTQVEYKLEAVAKPKPKKEAEKESEKKLKKPKEPTDKQSVKSTFFVTANFAYSLSPQASFGLTVGQVKRFGWFVSAMSNFNFKALQYDYTADADGLVDDNILLYNGESCSTRLSFLAGGMMRVVEPLYVRVGAGYGMRVKSWYTEDGYLVKMSDDSWSGIDLTAGVQLHLKGFVLSLDAVTTSFKDVEAKIGVGYSF